MDGKVVELTYKEHELLKYLMINKGMVLTREQLMINVWGTDFEGESRTVDMHIKTLRQKLKDAGANVIGTSPDDIDLAEDRDYFKQLSAKNMYHSRRL